MKYYGSFSSGTYLPVSDIDIVVTTRGKQMEKDNRALLMDINRLLFEDGIIERNSQIIPYSRIPLLKFYDSITGFPINITINTPRVMERSEFIRVSVLLFWIAC